MNEDAVTINVIPLPSDDLNLAPLDAGPHCPGSDFEITLTNSENNVNYQLTNGDVLLGAEQNGNGGDLLFSTGSMKPNRYFLYCCCQYYRMYRYYFHGSSDQY